MDLVRDRRVVCGTTYANRILGDLCYDFVRLDKAGPTVLERKFELAQRVVTHKRVRFAFLAECARRTVTGNEHHVIAQWP